MLQKVPTSLVQIVWSTTQGSLFVRPDILNYLLDYLKSGKWISYNFLHLMDINMF